jgi:outer membrane protein TolC
VPFTRPNAIALFAQPLLRRAGRSNNTRYIAIAKNNTHISKEVLEAQAIATISGVQNLYYDLISPQDAVTVQEKALDAAETLLSKDRQQLSLGYSSWQKLKERLDSTSSTGATYLQHRSHR